MRAIPAALSCICQGNLLPSSCAASAPGPGTTLAHAFRFADKTTHLEQVLVAKQEGQWVFFVLGDYSELFCSLVL